MGTIDIRFFHNKHSRRAQIHIQGESWASISVSQEIPYTAETIAPCKVNWSAWGDVTADRASAFAEGIHAALEISKQWDGDVGKTNFSEDASKNQLAVTSTQ